MTILTPKANWYEGNVGLFIPSVSSDAVPYNKHVGHCEISILTNPSFLGQVTISAVPTNANVDASALTIYVDGNFNQVVQFNVGAGLNTQQTVTVGVGASGVHNIRIQEGERDPGVFITQINVDGAIIPAPGIQRSYTTLGDSVAMGVFAVPRSQGWAQRMKLASRFDSVTNLGQSGYSLSTLILSGSLAGFVQQLVPSSANFVGNVENVIALCLGLNDWFPSGGSTSAATYQTNLTTLVDAIKVAADAQKIPGFKLMLHSLTWIVASGQVANAQGSTPANFNTAVQAVQAARPFTQFLNVFNACTDADMADIDHPNNVGHGKIYNVVLAAT